MTIGTTDRPTGSLLPRLEAAAERGNHAVFVDSDPLERVAWARLHEDARAMAAALQARGVAPGDRVALLGPTSRPLVTAIQAVWLAGAGITVLPLRTRLTSEEEFWRQTRARVALVDATLTIAHDPLAGGLDPEGVVTLRELEPAPARVGAERYARPPDDPDAVAIMQFTSGSTADPKGVVIPHRCVTDNLDGIGDRIPADRDDDVVVTWAPLYHDMGLIYLLANAMTVGAGLVISKPEYFVASPARWMEAMSELRGTWTSGPNFAFAVAARMLGHSGRVDLSACRSLGNGSEPIDAFAMERFAAAAEAHGLDPTGMYGGYGMAEATVAVSVPPRGTGFVADVVDAAALEDRRAEPVAPDHPRARRLARLGAPIRNMEARIVDVDTRTEVGQRRLGEIELRGPSVVPGYFRRPDATAAAFHDGWLRTGDLGYLADDELVIGGRLKDVIVAGGRNVLPQDLERAAEKVAGVRAGNVIAFGTEGGRHEEIVVVAETKADEPQRVRDDVARAVREVVGLRPAEVVLLRPGTLPKTSSGKLQRGLCRDQYLRAELDAV